MDNQPKFANEPLDELFDIILPDGPNAPIVAEARWYGPFSAIAEHPDVATACNQWPDAALVYRASLPSWDLDPDNLYSRLEPYIKLDGPSGQWSLEFEDEPFSSTDLRASVPRQVDGERLLEELLNSLAPALRCAANGFATGSGFSSDALAAWRKIEIRLNNSDLWAPSEQWLDLRHMGAEMLACLGEFHPWTPVKEVRDFCDELNGKRLLLGGEAAEYEILGWISKSRQELMDVAHNVVNRREPINRAYAELGTHARDACSLSDHSGGDLKEWFRRAVHETVDAVRLDP